MIGSYAPLGGIPPEHRETVRNSLDILAIEQRVCAVGGDKKPTPHSTKQEFETCLKGSKSDYTGSGQGGSLQEPVVEDL